MSVTWVDWVVIVMLVAFAVALMCFFISAKRPRRWIVRWGLWGLLFFAFEFWGAQSGNTLSENVVGSVPLWLVIAGTWVGAGVLTIHWIDLKNRMTRERECRRLTN